MHSIKKNIIWNLLGSVLPAVAGVIFFPLIIRAYGLDRFGLLTLAWALVGYFGLFDLGLSRALTQQISALRGKHNTATDIAELIRTSLKLMLGLGIIGGLILWFFAPLIIDHVFKISSHLRVEALSSFLILSISIPMVVHTSALRGILESLHMFKAVSLIRMVMGVGTFLGPYLASLISKSLEAAIYSLIVVRLIVWLMHYVAVFRSEILRPESSSFNSRWLADLFKFGGWLTLSNVIGPLMVYLDRFVIASILGAAAVTYYVAPYEVITKLWVIPAAITGVLFPLFAQHSESDSSQLIGILDRGARYTLLLLLPVCLILVYFSSGWLELWLGESFSGKSADVVAWLLAGILINSAAQVLYAKIQGIGRSDLTAKLHVLELLPYLILLWGLLNCYGIVGAAMAWCFRVVLDFFGLAWLVFIKHPQQKMKIINLVIFITFFTLLVLFIGIAKLALLRIALFTMAMLFALIFSYKQAVSDGLFNQLQTYLKSNK